MLLVILQILQHNLRSGWTRAFGPRNSARYFGLLCILPTAHTQSLPIICKAPTANRQRRWASYPTLWSTATLDCVATSREKTIIFNQLQIVNHSWSGVSQEKYTFNHPHKPCTHSVGLEVELCIWLCQSIWWPSSRCTNFTSHSARLQLPSKRKIEINSVFELQMSVKFKLSCKSTLHTNRYYLLSFMTSSNVIGI